MGEQRVDQQQPCAQRHARLAPAHQSPPVEPVREHAAVEAEDDPRQQFREPERADDERRPG
jgi:hypothetical protein